MFFLVHLSRSAALVSAGGLRACIEMCNLRLQVEFTGLPMGQYRVATRIIQVQDESCPAQDTEGQCLVSEFVEGQQFVEEGGANWATFGVFKGSIVPGFEWHETMMQIVCPALGLPPLLIGHHPAACSLTLPHRCQYQ